jgi:D-lyxose ketol-isomerase
VYNSLPDGSVDREGDVRILMDGIESTVPAGTEVEVTRGNSMTIYPGLYHLFTPKPGCGDLIVGEVSSINDDNTDNYFEDTPLLWKLRRQVSNLIEPVLLVEDMNNPLYRDISSTGIPIVS